MKTTKILLITLLSGILISCGEKITLDGKAIIVDSVQSINDSTYKVNLKCKVDPNAHEVDFITDFRYQAGDTMWSSSHYKKYYENIIIKLKTENRELKDSVFFYQLNLGNKIDDLNNQIKDLKNQNNALQNAFIKLK